ncbi:MAG: VOC family protein [Haloplanus sp.]
MTTLEQAYLMTADLERSRRFYEEGLALEPSRVGETSVAYETGDCELKIQADFDPEELAAFGMESPPASGRGAGVIHVLVVDDVDEAHRRASEAVEDVGGEILTEPQDVSWNGRLFLLESPDGYTFEIRQAEQS